MAYKVTVQVDTTLGNEVVTYDLDNQYAVTLFGAGVQSIKGFVIFCSGKPLVNEIIGGGIAPYTFTANTLNCVARSLSPSTATVQFSIYNNGTAIGTITFASSNTGTISLSAPAIANGDYVYVVTPNDATDVPSDISVILKE